MAGSDHRAVLRQQIQAATLRYRWERLARQSRLPAWVVCGVLLLALMAGFFVPGIFAHALGWMGAAAGLGVLTALVIFLRQVDSRKVQARMDALAQWPDSVQTSASWAEQENNEWQRLQQEQTAELMKNPAWRQAWRIRWPRLAWVPGLGAITVALLLLLGQARWQEAQARATALEAPDEVVQAQREKLEEVFKDWEEAQKQEPDPELEALLKDLEPLREKLAGEEISEKEMFLEINKIQDRLQAMQSKLDKESLEPLAAELSEALESVEGAAGVAAALKRKDFEAAFEQAKKAEEKMQKEGAQMPSGEQAEKAAQKLGAMAKKAEEQGQQQLSKSMQQMQQGMKENSGEKMNKGMSGLKDCLNGQCNGQGKKKSLGTQMAQMNACKNGEGQGQGQGISMGPPKLSLAKQKEGSQSAGTGTDPNRFGAETQLEASRQQVGVTGMAGEGDSNVQTESSQVPVLEQTASGVNAQQFAAYEKMSRQAAEDENIPLAHRQAIKRYFENIRPKQGQ